MTTYVVKVKVLVNNTYRTKEIEYTGRRHSDYNTAYREFERALNDKNNSDVVMAWIEAENDHV